MAKLIEPGYRMSPELCFGDALIVGPDGFQAVAPWMSAEKLRALLERMNSEHMTAERAHRAIKEALDG